MTIGDGTSESTLVTFSAGDTIPTGGFFLLARATDVFNNVTVDKTFSTSLPNTGTIILRLYNNGVFIDSANLGRQSGWYAGTASPNYASMERRGKILDGPNAWFTFGGTPFALNRDGASVRGTPKQANWAVNITPTPTVFRTPTRTPTPIRTPTAVIAIDPRPIINEILARPGFDWNRDGRVDVLDEFIEIKNLTAIDINLGGWRLDKADSGASFTLPSRTLKPGERAAFYGSDTGFLLSDGGETIRLISPGGKIYDAYTYAFARAADQSFCRLPDGNVFGSWFEDCIPTPNLSNTREGEVPAMPGGAGETPACDLPDTLPVDFFFAECRGYGSSIWNPFYWDQLGGQGWRIIPANAGKWASIIE